MQITLDKCAVLKFMKMIVLPGHYAIYGCCCFCFVFLARPLLLHIFFNLFQSLVTIMVVVLMLGR